MRLTRGFTIVEMMVVVGVVAILALMMIPTYHERFVRDQVNEALPLAEIAKRPVAAAWTVAQALPADNAAAGLPPGEKIVSDLVSSVAVEAGAVHVTFGNRANNLLQGKTLTLRPAVVEDAPVVPVTWVCGFAAAPDKMKLKGPNRTSVPPGYLPLRCQSR